MEIIGQKNLLEKFNNYTAATFPKTTMLIGEDGCGKHFFAKYLAEKFDLDYKIILEDVSSEDLIEYSQKAIPTLYIIDLANFTDKQQNQFLKFIEEPAQSVYVVLLAASESGILPTILNRCIKYYFDEYSVDELKKINTNSNIASDLLYKLCRTPGKIARESSASAQTAYDLCLTLVHKIKEASWANTLKIATKINYKENYSLLNFDLFLDTLEYVAFEDYKQNKTELSFIIYGITNNAKQQLLNKKVAKENFMLAFLTTLWKGTR